MPQPQFSIRTLLLLTCVVCFVAGWARWQKMERRRLVAAVDAIGGQVILDKDREVSVLLLPVSSRSELDIGALKAFPQLERVSYFQGDEWDAVNPPPIILNCDVDNFDYFRKLFAGHNRR